MQILYISSYVDWRILCPKVAFKYFCDKRIYSVLNMNIFKHRLDDILSWMAGWKPKFGYKFSSLPLVIFSIFQRALGYISSSVTMAFLERAASKVQLYDNNHNNLEKEEKINRRRNIVLNGHQKNTVLKNQCQWNSKLVKSKVNYLCITYDHQWNSRRALTLKHDIFTWENDVLF